MSEAAFKYEDGLPDLRPGEPFFFLRAQDVLAPFAVMQYAALRRAAAAGVRRHPGGFVNSEGISLILPENGLREQADHAEQIAARMLAWQATNGHKLPD